MAKSDKQKQFAHIVGVMLPIISGQLLAAQKDAGVPPKKRVHIKEISDTLGKAWKVSDAELEHHHGNVSDKAIEFISYQLYITHESPIWYRGAAIKRG